MDRELTQLIEAWREGDLGARDTLLAAAYGRIQQIAAQAVRRNSHATLSPTELANEAMIRLLGADASWEDRRHFFHVAAAATRQILVDRARRRLADRRGAGERPLSLDEVTMTPGADAELLRLHEALDALKREHERAAQTLEMSYFGGFDREEIAAALELSVTTVDRDLRFARAWLKAGLTG